MALKSIVLLSLALGAAQAQPAQPAPPLTEQLRAIAAQHHGEVALFAENLQTHQSVSLAPDTVVQTASTIKLTILYEALQQIRDGKAHWDDPITLNKSDQVPGSGLLLFFDTPLPLTLKDVLTMMIVMSDNTAANLAMDHLGIDAINQRSASLGLKNTYLYKKVFTPVTPGTVLPEDQKKYGLGKSTPREIASVMTRLATCQLGDPAKPGEPAKPGDPALCAAALKMLHVQFYRSAIPRYLDALPGATGDSIANKTGSLEAVRADIAAISSKHGLIVISCFTYNNQDRSWGAEQEGELTIARLARAIVQAWSPDGLAPWPKP